MQIIHHIRLIISIYLILNMLSLIKTYSIKLSNNKKLFLDKKKIKNSKSIFSLKNLTEKIINTKHKNKSARNLEMNYNSPEENPYYLNAKICNSIGEYYNIENGCVSKKKCSKIGDGKIYLITFYFETNESYEVCDCIIQYGYLNNKCIKVSKYKKQILHNNQIISNENLIYKPKETFLIKDKENSYYINCHNSIYKILNSKVKLDYILSMKNIESSYNTCNNNIMNNCPEENLNSYYYNNNKCYECPIECKSCDNISEENNNHCTECKDEYYYIESSKSCKQKCPIGFGTLSNKQKICKNCFENDLLYYDNKCYLYQPDNSYDPLIGNGIFYKCLQEIENNKIFTGFYIEKNLCKIKCPSGYLYTNDNICEKCNPACKDCSQISYDKNNMYCNECIEGFIFHPVLNGVCIEDCKKNFIYGNYNEKICFDECPEEFPFENQFNLECVKSCFELNLLIENNYTCVQQCSFGFYLFDDKYCLKNCPFGFGNDNINFICIKCSEVNKFYFENECYDNINDIESDFGVFYDSNSDNIIKECFEELDDEYVFTNYYKYNNYCKILCPDGYYYLGNNLCVKCFDYCKSCNEVGNENNNLCLSCYEGFKLNNNNCELVCDGKYYYNQNNEITCILNSDNCNQEYPYNIINTNECISDCLNKNMLLNENKCVKKCPKEKNYIYNNECLSSCPSNINKIIIINNEIKECVNSCKEKNMFNYKNICYSKENIPKNTYFDPEYNNNEDNYLIEGCFQSIEEDTIITKGNCDINNCNNICPEGYLYEGNNICKKCHKLCKKCNQIGNDCDNKCLECIDNYIINPFYEDKILCVKKCDKFFSINENNGMFNCLDNCNLNFIYPENNLCSDKCNYLIYDNIYCVKKCPNNLKEINGYCLDNYNLLISENDINQVYKLLNNNLQNIISNPNDNIPYFIKKNDNVIQIYSSENKNKAKEQSINEQLSYINFDECEKKIREKYSYSNNIPLYFLKVDNKTKNIKDNNLISSLNIEYKVFDSNYNEININDICKNIFIDISTPLILPEELTLTLEEIKNFSKEGIDVFNINDSFFNAFCYPYSDKNGNDISLKDRIKDIYQNISLCPSGCFYNNINYENERMNCNCSLNSIQKDYNNSNTNENNNKEKDLGYGFEMQDVIKIGKSKSLKVIKCYNLVFNSKYIIKNCGFWFFLFFEIGEILILIFMLLFGFIKLHSFLHRISNKNNPPKKTNNIESNKKIFESPQKNIRISSFFNQVNNSSSKKLRIINHPSFFKIKNEMKKENENNSIRDLTINNNIDSKNNSNNSNKLFLSKYKSINPFNLGENNSIKITNEDNKLNDDNNKIKNKKDIKTILVESVNKNNINMNNEENTNIINSQNDLINKNKNNENFMNEKNNNNNIILTNNSNKDEELNEANFEMVMLKDNRTFCQIYLSFLSNNQLLISIIENKNPFEPRLIKIGLFIISISLFFTLNALLYDENMIENRYKNKKKCGIIYLIKHEISKSFFASFISNIMNLIVSFVFIHYDFLLIIQEKNKKENNFMIKLKKLLKREKIKYLIICITMIIIIGFEWYFCIAFCSVYKGYQISWVESSILTLAINLILSFLLLLIASLFRKLSCKFKSWILFKMSGFLIAFS